MAIVPANVKLMPVSTRYCAPVAEFLHREMNSKVSIDQWQRVVEVNWAPDAPNHGNFPDSIVLPDEDLRQVSEYRFSKL